MPDTAESALRSWLPTLVRLLAVTVAVGGTPLAATAQEQTWGIGAEIGLSRFWGASAPVSPNTAPGVKPYRPTTLVLRLDRHLGRARVSLGVQYAQSSLGAEDDQLLTAVKGGVNWWQFTPELAWRLGTLGPVTGVRAFGGPTVDVWKAEGEDGRVRIGGQVGLELHVPVGAHLGGTLRLRGGLTRSLFDQKDLPADFELRQMPTSNLALGLRYGW